MKTQRKSEKLGKTGITFRMENSGTNRTEVNMKEREFPSCRKTEVNFPSVAITVVQCPSN